jgi:hypothetical protein
MKSQKLQNLLTEKENIAHFDLIRRFTTLSISKIELDDFLLLLRYGDRRMQNEPCCKYMCAL